MSRLLLATVVLVLTLSVGGFALEAQYEQAGAPETRSEQLASSGGLSPGVHELDRSNIDEVHYAQSVNVTNESGLAMVEDHDYQWHASNGTLDVLAGGGLDGSNATVEYTYYNPGHQQDNYIGLMGRVFSASDVLVVAFGVVLVLAVLSVVAEM